MAVNKSPADGIVLLQVQDLPARIADLKEAGLRFRNEMEAGPGGKQIQMEDPDGNPIELFEFTEIQKVTQLSVCGVRPMPGRRVRRPD